MYRMMDSDDLEEEPEVLDRPVFGWHGRAGSGGPVPPGRTRSWMPSACAGAAEPGRPGTDWRSGTIGSMGILGCPDLCGRGGRRQGVAWEVAGGLEEEAEQSGREAHPDSGVGAAYNWDGVVKGPDVDCVTEEGCH